MHEYKRRGIDVVMQTEPEGGGILALLGNAWRARRAARGVDVVQAFDGWPYSAYAWGAVLGTRKKLFIIGVGTYTVAPLDYFVKRVLLRRAYRRAQKIFCMSAYTRARLLEKMPLGNVVVIHFGASPMPELSASERASYEAAFNLGKGAPVILTIGEIKERKGQIDTLRAIIRLRSEFPNIQYVVVGSDANRAYVEAMRSEAARAGMQDHLHIITGARDDKALSYLYQSSDIYAMNSRSESGHFEGFGLVFLEAGLFGKPGVGSRGSGIEDAIADGVSGFLCAQGDDQDIAEKLRMILTGDRVAWSARARAHAEKFTWTRTVAAYERHYATPSPPSFVRTLWNRVRGAAPSPRRYAQIFDIIRGARPRIIMEVGTWNGGRAVEMIRDARAVRPGERISYIGFDLFEDLSEEMFYAELSKRPPPEREVRARLMATGAHITLIKGDTNLVMRDAVAKLPAADFIFIDGGHRYETIKNDWECARAALAPGGIVIFDDYWHGRADAGCARVIDEIDPGDYAVSILPIVDQFTNPEFGSLIIQLVMVRRRV